jgi:shikimate kinase/3-dehydroquinate synthase
MEERRRAYGECHARVATDGKSPDDVARAVLAVWQRDPIAVAAWEHSYSVEIGSGIAAERTAALVRGASLGLLVTDEHVSPLHADPIENGIELGAIPSATVVLPPGEEHKNTTTLERIWSAALTAGADRKSVFVALGGGVVTDVVGFAAATWMRGVRWIGIPTTLLAMVDASVGGKTAIDLRDAKNGVGAFHQPSAVLCDVDHLLTEPLRGYTSALADANAGFVHHPEHVLEALMGFTDQIANAVILLAKIQHC